jgi:hypothetical protein
MTYPAADLVRMILRNNPMYSEPKKPRIFEGSEYEHPWYTYLKKPNPPTEEQVKKAQFKDKTYKWPKK